MDIVKKAKQLIEHESKIWLSNKLGITRSTLDIRLEKDNWKKTEIHMILSLTK